MLLNENGDRVWYERHYVEGDIVYPYGTTSQPGKVVAMKYRELPHLNEYAPKGKKVVEQLVLVRWLKNATRKKYGEESWRNSQRMCSFVLLVEEHQRKAKTLGKVLKEAQQL